MKQKLGRMEAQFFAYVQMRQIRTVRTGDLAGSVLRLSPDQERKLERALRPTSSLIPWIPTQPKRGIANRRWGVVMNERA